MTLLSTVLTQHIRAPRGKLTRHGVGLQKQVKPSEMTRHILHGLLADRARISRLSIGFVALPMHGMPTQRQYFIVRRTREQWLGTHWTVPLQRLLDALVLLWGHVKRYTRIARHAVSEVNPKPLPQPAHITVGTVIYRLSRRIVIQPTDIAVVSTEGLPTPLVPTRPRRRLELTTMHATNFRNCIAIHRVVSRRLVVAKTTRV